MIGVALISGRRKVSRLKDCLGSGLDSAYAQVTLRY